MAETLSNTKITILNPTALFNGPEFSHVGITPPGVRMIYCSGQVGADVDKVPAEGLEAQSRLAFQNVKTCLAAAGASLRDIVKLTYFVVNWNEDKVMAFGRPLYEFLTDDEGLYKSPSTLVSVNGLADPRWLVEIECVAAIKV